MTARCISVCIISVAVYVGGTCQELIDKFTNQDDKDTASSSTITDKELLAFVEKNSPRKRASPRKRVLRQQPSDVSRLSAVSSVSVDADGYPKMAFDNFVPSETLDDSEPETLHYPEREAEAESAVDTKRRRVLAESPQRGAKDKSENAQQPRQRSAKDKSGAAKQPTQRTAKDTSGAAKRVMTTPAKAQRDTSPDSATPAKKPRGDMPHSRSFGVLYITRATAQSYIQVIDKSSGKKVLLIGITSSMDEDHRAKIERIVEYAKGSKLTKELVKSYRDSLVYSES